MEQYAKIRGAEVMVKCLLANGVQTIFGYPGGAIMPFYDALYDYAEELKHVLVRHEQGAVHAAQGFARVSGKPGVCVATSGPGATNLLTGLADAMADSTPLVCLTGQVPSPLLGTDAFQETDVVALSAPVTKWNVLVKRAADLPSALNKAFKVATSGRPGPVLVDVTKDAQNELVAYETLAQEFSLKAKKLAVPTLEQVTRVAALLNQAEKPFVLVGQGVLLSKAESALQACVEKADLPVAATLLGLGALPVSHANYMGMLGMHGDYAPNLMTNACDVLLAVGMRFDDRVTGKVSAYAKQAKVVHVDVDAAELNKIIPATEAVHADATSFLTMLLPLLKEKKHTNWKNQFAALQLKELKVLGKRNLKDNPEGMKMKEVCAKLSLMTKGDAVLVTDVGQHQMEACRNYQFGTQAKNVTSGGLGTMGFALPAALGAKLASPQQTVLMVAGDGGFQMNIQELGTVAQYKVGVKMVVLNNNFLGMVRQWQQLFFEKRYSFTEMHNPDFVTLASAYNIKGKKVNQSSDLDAAIKEMLSDDEPYVLEVVVEKEDNVFPMIPAGAAVDEVLLCEAGAN